MRLESIAAVLNGDRGKNYPAKSKLTTEGIPFVSAINIDNGIVVEDQMLYMTEAQFKALRAGKLQHNDIVFCIRGSLGKFGVFPFEEGAIASSLVIVRPLLTEDVLRRFLICLFDAPITLASIRSYDNGTAQPNLAAKNFEQFLYPLPPADEQIRILKRVAELLPLVDDYGALEDSRERLDADLPDKIRKSILQLAVQGRLVEQDPADEPASALLDRIRAERAALIKAGKLKAPKGGESVIYRGSDGGYYEKRGNCGPQPVEVPFDIPESWEWVRLESVTTYIQRGKSPKYSEVKQYPVVAQKCNQWSGFSLEKAKFIDPNTVDSYDADRILCDGDLLWNSTGLGTLGRMVIYDSTVNPYGWAVADSHVTVIRTLEDWLSNRFAFLYFSGPYVQSVIEGQSSGSTKQKELAQETVCNYLFPLPPIREQERIVECAESTMRMIG